MDDLFSAQGDLAPQRIRVGIGGWNYAPWRNKFYPAGLPQRRELEYASRQLSAIEINSTYYGTQKPATYAKWRDETPAGFVFSAKAPKRIMQARSLAGAQAQIEDFIGGIAEIGDKLGPLVWQFEKGRQVDLGELQDFLAALPRTHAGRNLRHALEIRDPARVDRELIALARHHGVATVFTDSVDYPSFADLGGDFVYARLMRSRSQLDTGYTPAELAQWADRARRWAQGQDLPELPHAAAVQASAASPRDVFIYFISSAKERNPAAAMALLREIGAP
ncbi:DUF72 domain-containing protein [Pseudoxanthomonas wuyuanensis]